MLPFLLFILIAWLMTAAGRQVMSWLRLPATATILERMLIGFAVGLGLLAYGMLMLGLVHGFFPGPAVGLLAALLLLGAREHERMAAQIRARFARGFRPTPLEWGASALFVLFAVVALSGVYAPPTLLEWDSVAYHLADPKLYVRAHRIFYLPWEDHSNFAFNLEMCYTLGLLFRSIVLAKLFHFACGIGLIGAVYRLGTLLFSKRVALWAALLLASCPIIFWEAGTAYVDLGVAFYATLTLLALAHGIRERNERWLWVGAILMGLTLSTKGTALGVLGLLTLGLLVWRFSQKQGVGRSVGLAALWCVAALVVGSPWYIKSFVYTGNPVYPFFSHLLGGRYWSAAAAEAYNVWNASFGAGHGLPELVLAPWNLTMAVLPGHIPFSTQAKLPSHPAFNDYQTPVMTLTPMLVSCLFLPVLFVGRIPMAVKALSVYVLASVLVWFVTAQHVRYILPILPVMCLLTGWVLDKALAERLRAGRALTGVAICSFAFSLFVGGQLLVQQLPVDFGSVPRAAYIAQGDPAYAAMQFVNRELPAESKVVFYGNPLGFYCSKPYLWGEPGHSTYVTGEAPQSAEELRRRLASLGVTHILVNTRFFTPAPNAGGIAGTVYALTVGTGLPVYGDPTDPHQHVFVYALPDRTSESNAGILRGKMAHSSSWPRTPRFSARKPVVQIPDGLG